MFRNSTPRSTLFTLYEIAAAFTRSGGTAALDMMLKLIENQHGRSWRCRYRSNSTMIAFAEVDLSKWPTVSTWR